MLLCCIPNFLLSLFKEHYHKLFIAFKLGGANRTRTDRLLRAKQALYQMSYGPLLSLYFVAFVHLDSVMYLCVHSLASRTQRLV